MLITKLNILKNDSRTARQNYYDKQKNALYQAMSEQESTDEPFIIAYTDADGVRRFKYSGDITDSIETLLNLVCALTETDDLPITDQDDNCEDAVVRMYDDIMRYFSRAQERYIAYGGVYRRPQPIDPSALEPFTVYSLSGEENACDTDDVSDDVAVSVAASWNRLQQYESEEYRIRRVLEDAKRRKGGLDA